VKKLSTKSLKRNVHKITWVFWEIPWFYKKFLGDSEMELIKRCENQAIRSLPIENGVGKQE